jgi:hypothetical protein
MPVLDELRELNERAWNGEKGENMATHITDRRAFAHFARN